MNKNKSNTSVRLTPEAAQLLKDLAKKLGVSQTAIIEMSIRKLAQQERVQSGQSKTRE